MKISMRSAEYENQPKLNSLWQHKKQIALHFLDEIETRMNTFCARRWKLLFPPFLERYAAL
jgi:hypothetical protein